MRNYIYESINWLHVNLLLTKELEAKLPYHLDYSAGEARLPGVINVKSIVRKPLLDMGFSFVPTSGYGLHFESNGKDYGIILFTTEYGRTIQLGFEDLKTGKALTVYHKTCRNKKEVEQFSANLCAIIGLFDEHVAGLMSPTKPLPSVCENDKYLVKNSIGASFDYDIFIEKITDDMLMVSVQKASPRTDELFYWKLTNHKNVPPLEIGINGTDRHIENITIFIDRSMLARDIVYPTKTEFGSVIVDGNSYSGSCEFTDRQKNLSINFKKDKVVFYFGRTNIINEAVKNGKLEFYIDSENNIVGFAISDLTLEEYYLVTSIF